MSAPLATTSVAAFHTATTLQDPTSANVKKGTETMEQTAYVCNAPFITEILKTYVSHFVNFKVQLCQTHFLLTIFNTK